MTRDQALTVLRRLRSRLEARGIAHAGVFGSVARDESGSRSDVDIVVTPAQGAKLDLFDLGGVQTILEEGFGGVDVDVVVEPIGETGLKGAIERDRAHAF